MSATIYGVTWTVTIGDIDGFTSRKLSLPGTTGSHVQADFSDAGVPGDIEIVTRVEATDYSTGVIQTMVSKGSDAYEFNIGTTGKLMLRVNGVNKSSSSTPPLEDGRIYWLRVRRSSSDGAIEFFYADDQPTEPTSWTSTGTASSTAGAIATSSHDIRVGLRANNFSDNEANPFGGSIYNVIVRDGFDGADVVTFSPARGLVGKSTFTEATGETWTLTGSAAFVGVDGDFTSFVQGLQVKQGGPIGRVNPGTLNLRLDNSTGLFTPGLSNEYSDVDWFTKAITVTAQVDAGGGGQQTASDVFHGVIRQFKLTDDGHHSYADIVGHDALTVAARGPQINVFGSGFASATPSQVVEGLLSTSFDSQDPGITFPRLNETSNAVFDLGDTPTTPQLRSSALPTANARQLIDNHVLPSGPFVLWATDIEHDSGNNRAKYKGCMVGNTLRKTTVDDGSASANGDAGTTGSRYNRRTFEFTDDKTSTSALLFAGVQFDFTNSELANRCTTIPTFSGTSAQGSQSTDSISLYGVRAKDFPQTVNETNTTALEVSNFWAVRFADIEFAVHRLELGQANAEIATGGSATQKRMLGDLLDIRSGLWNASNLSISKLRGQSAADTRTVTIIGRTINVTPDRFSITLDVRGSSQYGAFILDESRLDQDRIF